MPKLIVKQQGFEDTFKIDKPKMSIGRSSRNEICIIDPFASRLHAEIRREGDSMFLVDMGGVNGTFRNDLRVVGRCPLIIGDRIRIGETEMRLLADDAEGGGEHTRVLVSDKIAPIVPEATIMPGMNSRLTSTFRSGIQPNVQPSVQPGIQSGLQHGAQHGVQPGGGAVAPAIAEQRMNPTLLQVISRVGVALLSNGSMEETLKQVMDLVFDTVPADRGYLMLYEADDETRNLHCKVARTRSGFIDTEDHTIEISRSIIDRVTREMTSILTSDAAHDARFAGSQSIILSNVRSVMAVPLAIDDEALGMIYVDSPFNINRFTEDDLQVLTALAGVAAIKIENSKLLEERLEKRRLEEELAVASEIQLRLQPVAPPTVLGYEMTGISFPCREIGGDYYDFIERSDGQLVVALGDVSGKGTGAALLMASLHAGVRAQTQAHNSLSDVMREISNYLYKNSPDNKYATLFMASLDPKTGQLVYSNAGHNPPLLVSSSYAIQRLEEGGMPVGLMPNAEYTEGSVLLTPGDILLMFSDGITESVNLADEEFGEARLIELATQYCASGAARVRDKVEEGLSRFVGKAAPVDDMTLVILKRQ